MTGPLIWFLMACGSASMGNAGCIVIPVPYATEDQCAIAAEYAPRAYCIPAPKPCAEVCEL